MPSISPWDAAGENISLSMRLDRDFAGRAMIKRVMPRQNEWVNEIWISDKTRFVHHFTRSDDRLQTPLMRSGDRLQEANWGAVLKLLAAQLKEAAGDVAAIAGSGLSNEDLWQLRQLVEGVGGSRLGAWSPTHGGAASVARAGIGSGTNLGQLGKGDAILVIACDLEEEVPLWHLRLKGAQDRGAYLVVANARSTRLEDFALQGARNDKVVTGDAIRYSAGYAAALMSDIKRLQPDIAARLGQAENLVIVTGAEGLTLAGSEALAAAAANFLIETGHVGRANNGLLAALPGPNGMGQHYLGFTPAATLDIVAEPPKTLILAGCEPLDDDPGAREWLSRVETLIYVNLFDDGASEFADFVLPIQSFAERDGSFVNGERRVQRFYAAQGPMGQALPAWKLFGGIGQAANLQALKPTAAAVMAELSKSAPAFAGMTYKALAKVERQFPDVGGRDLYYGGTAYTNSGGLGLQIPAEADEHDLRPGAVDLSGRLKADAEELIIMPVARLYNRQRAFRPTTLLDARVPAPHLIINSEDAAERGIGGGDLIELQAGPVQLRLRADVSDAIAKGAVAVPRHLSDAPAPLEVTTGQIKKVAAAVAAGD